MPLIVPVPKNSAFIAKERGYRTHLNVLDRTETAVQRQLRRGGTGSYEPDFQATLLALCEVCQGPLSVYDVGAHIGFYSALISTVFSRRDLSVVAFEPTPKTNHIARLIRDKNGLAYSIVKSAISDTHGAADLHISDKAETSNSLNPNFRGGSDIVTVPLTTIDRFCDETHLPPKVMKIDVETMEAFVLRGSLKMIQKHRPVITLEILSSVERMSMLSMLKAIEGFGYHFYRVEAQNSDWRALDADGAMKAVSSKNRDWVCAPSELSKAFFVARQEWKNALLPCDESANILVGSGQQLPAECLGFYS